jgi:hypothetical protein
MTRWPDSDGAAFRQYVYGLTLRTPLAARVYRCILRGFQQFVSEHRSPSRMPCFSGKRDRSGDGAGGW